MNPGGIVRRQPQPPLKAYVVWGAVAAMRLPERLELGKRVLVVRIPDDEALEGRELPRLDHPKFGGPIWSAVPGHVRIQSRWRIWFRIDAETEEEACRVVYQSHLPPVMAALSAIDNSQVSIVLTRVGIESESGHIPESRSPWGPSSFFLKLDTAVTTDVENKVVASYELVARTNPDCLAVCQYYAVANQMTELSSNHAPFVAAVLLRYFQCIELVSEKTTRSLEVDGKDFSRTLSRLRSALNGSGTTEMRVRSVENAATDLRRIQGAYLSQKIRASGDALGVPTESIKSAEHLCRLRNTRLGHPTSDTGDFASEVPPAARAAREYMLAFLRDRSQPKEVVRQR